MNVSFRVLLSSVFLLTVLIGHSQVVINEFMASNSSVIDDPEFFDSGDWVELYNTSGTTADIGGYFLTDNLNDTTQWMIPVGTLIPGNGFLLIWADGNDVGLHANYKLSSAGEEIGLYDVDEELVDSFVYSAQETDISRGRESDGVATWSWYNQSTPGTSNNPAIAYEGVTFFVPYFSTKGGHFESEQSIELTSLGGTIRYTLDGRSPTANDAIYSGIIDFSDQTFIRARVFVENEIPGPVVTHSYFFDPSIPLRELPYVSLVTDPDFFWDDDIGLYVQSFKPDWEHPVNIEFFENDGNNQSVFNERAGVKVNGQNSWVLPQKMLGIYFDNQYGSGNLDYPIFDDRDRTVFDDIILRASGSDWAQTVLRDGLSQHLTQDNAPVPHQGFRQSIVFINGEYMGISNIRSRLNGDFIEQNYGYASGTYDLIDNDGDVDEGNDDQYDALDAMLNSDLTDQANFDALSEVLDIENYADYWMAEIWCGNGSWAHNVKLWKPHTEGKWRFLMQDFDRAFLGTDDEMVEHTSPSSPNGTAYGDYTKHWMQHITENQGFRDYFSRRFNDHIYTTYHPRTVNQVIDDFSGNIADEMVYHADRWAGTTSSYGNGIVSVDFWEDEIQVMRAYAESRQGLMMTNLEDYFGLDEYVSLSVSNLPNGGGTIDINEFKVPESPWTGLYFTNMASQFTAIPNPGYDFVGWSTMDQQLIIDLEEDWKYHDQGVDLGDTWTDVNFDDNSWAEGQAELGYGDGDENTVVSFGPDPNNKYVTTYFRKTFDYTGAEGPTACILSVRRDDGMVAYVNGVEVARSSMPDGPIAYDTYASVTAADEDEETLVDFDFEAYLNAGENTIAVEVHQIVGNSSDISFDAKIVVMTAQEAIFQSEAVLDFSITEVTGYVARYVPTGECLLPETVEEDLTLTIDCSPYLTSGNCTVLPDVTLTIDPGVDIWFTDEDRLIIQGDLQANGTEAQHIVFANNQDYGSESWGNVTFENCTADNNLSWMSIQQATDGPHPVHHRAAISSWYSTVNMDHMIMVENGSNPIFAEYSDISLTNSTIRSLVTGDLINVKYGDGYIDNCTFLGNDQVDTDAIDYDVVNDGVISNTTISGFYGFNSDGIDLGEGSQNTLIENCLIENCTDKGISCGQGSTAVLRNTTIVNCAQGLGIKDLGVVEIDHLTAYSNAIAVACFEKNPGQGGGTAIIENSILSNSSDTPVFVDDDSTVEVGINIYDTDTMPGDQVWWADPLFLDAPHFGLDVANSSPAIGAGSDGLNLGTNWFDYSVEPSLMISQIQYEHLENPDREFISILNDGDVEVNIGGYTLSNAVQFLFPDWATIQPGEELTVMKDVNLPPDLDNAFFVWDSGQLNNAGEMIILSDSYGVIVDHVLYSPSSPWPAITLQDQYLQLVETDLDNHFATSWELSEVATDIEDLGGNDLRLYPNPAYGEINVCSREVLGSIQVFDMAGKVVLERRISAVCVNLNVDDLNPGIYLVKAESGLTKKFVKS